MISVIIPVYKVEKYIENCMKSVMNQDYRDYEIILIDDGSPDKSINLAEDLLKREAKTNYRIIHTENRGVSAARNTGIQAAKGDYIIMVDSDDVLSERFLSTYVSMIEKRPGLNLYSTCFQVVDEGLLPTNNTFSNEVSVLSFKDAQELFFARRIVFLLPTLLMKKDFILGNKILFDENVRYSEDVQFIWRCLCKNKFDIIHSDVRNYTYLLHSGSTMTASNVDKISTGFSGLSKMMDEISVELVPDISDCFFSLYCFNLIHGAAHILDYKSYYFLYKKYNLKQHYRCLSKKHPWISYKIRMLCIIARMLPYLGYFFLYRF